MKKIRTGTILLLVFLLSINLFIACAEDKDDRQGSGNSWAKFKNNSSTAISISLDYVNYYDVAPGDTLRIYFKGSETF